MASFKESLGGFAGNKFHSIRKSVDLSGVSKPNLGNTFKTGIGLTIGLTAGIKAVGWANNRINSTLQTLYPENMLPTMQGKFGKRTDGLSQSPVQGVKFNFRRK